jgi:fumarate hydratase, class II
MEHPLSSRMERRMSDVRTEFDSLGAVEVSADKLWGPQTQRSLQHFSIGKDLIPREMITAYAILKRSAAIANHAGGRLDDTTQNLIVRVCNELLAGQHHEMFPLHVWMTGSGTQFNMNVNEVISNRCCQLSSTALGSKAPVHPNDHVNMSQSSNDSFPSAMYIAARRRTEGSLSAGAWWHGGWHRHQCGARLCRGSRCRDCQAHAPALRQRAKQIYRTGRA